MATGADAAQGRFADVSIPEQIMEGLSTPYALEGKNNLHAYAVSENWTAIYRLSFNGTEWTREEVSGLSDLSDYERVCLGDIAPLSVGNGILTEGYPFGRVSDTYFIRSSDNTFETLGLIMGSGATKQSAASATMFHDTLYLITYQEPASSGGKEVAALASGSTGMLFAAPAAISATLGSLDVSLQARASGSGSAQVADWRATPGTGLAVRMHDTATWTATTNAGATFAGWYDEAGSLVSSDAVYAAPAATNTVLEARFENDTVPENPASSGTVPFGGAGPSLLAPSSDAVPATLCTALALGSLVVLVHASRKKGSRG